MDRLQFCDGADVSISKNPTINSTSDVNETASFSEDRSSKGVARSKHTSSCPPGGTCNNLIFVRFILIVFICVYTSLHVTNCLCVYFGWDY